MRTKPVFPIIILALLVSNIQAQQYNSVPLGHEAYALIEMGVVKGAIAPPAAVRPWSELIIRQKLAEMADNALEKFSERELAIINNARKAFSRQNGWSWTDGRYYTEQDVGKSKFTFDATITWDSFFSVRVPDSAAATVNRGTVNAGGDMGSWLSWNYNIGGGFLKVERELLGIRPDPPYVDIVKHPGYDGNNPDSRGDYYHYDLRDPSESPVYSIPAFFPYTFTKPYEGGVFPPNSLGSYLPWPDSFSFFYEMLYEINASFFDNRLYMRFGRMRRDWGPAGTGASLVLNAAARPFMAFEGTAIPFNWLRFSFLTGTLDYLNNGNQWSDADPFQNMIGMAMIEIDTGKHFHMDFGSVAIYPKRMELGYIFPLSSNFFYQNNIGDFDNLAIYGNLELRFLQFKIWGSLFIDEMKPSVGEFFTLDRNMYAYQGGLKAAVSWLPFGVFTLRYTKIEPYCYTHEYTETPWLRVPIDTAYINNGEGIGSYLPPNSDELLVRLESMILPGLRANLQYQFVRHGTDWGYRRVDGSSIWDKIVKRSYSKKYFLRDGAYQWDHVIKLGGEYSLKTMSIPVAFYADTGIVITRFTNSDADLGKEGNYSVIDNEVYRAGNHFILSLGFRIYP